MALAPKQTRLRAGWLVISDASQETGLALDSVPGFFDQPRRLLHPTRGPGHKPGFGQVGWPGFTRNGVVFGIRIDCKGFKTQFTMSRACEWIGCRSLARLALAHGRGFDPGG